MNQIIVCVDDQYINQLHNNITEYATVTPKELLDHIWKMYRDIKKTDRMMNKKRTKALWSPPNPAKKFKQAVSRN